MDIISTQWKLRPIQFIYYSCLCFSLAMSASKLYQDEPMGNSDSSTPKQSFVFLSESIEQPVYFQSLKKDVLAFNWQVDLEEKSIITQISFTNQKERVRSPNDRPVEEWIAIGFSNYGAFDNADFCVFWVDWRGRAHLQDAYTTENSTRLQVDKDSQDCKNFQAQFVTAGGMQRRIEGIVWSYTRKFETCTKKSYEDYNIEDGTTHLIWSYGHGPLYRLTGVDVKDSASTVNGHSLLRIVRPVPELTDEDDLRILDIQHSEIKLPDDDTTYWCSVHKLPEDFTEKHHSVQYEPIITPGNEHVVHHMEIFHCDSNGEETVEEERDELGLETFPLWAGPCGSNDAPPKLSKCKKVLAAWAIGAGPFKYPKKTGLAIGGNAFNQYIMLEVHYNNPHMEKGIVDQSGMRFLVTKNLRPYDAGIMELGLVYTDKMAIPPNMESFSLSGYCLPECTAVGFPLNGINIFASQLHTHGAGIKVSTKHYRDGVELAEINRDDHYSTHFQEIRLLHSPQNILPGDNLVTTCWYNTIDRSNVTVGGFSFADEMCVNYIHYYPRAEALEICKSAISDKSLDSYFEVLNKWENLETDIQKGSRNATRNYHTIDWTPKRSFELSELYSTSSVGMQCQAGGGEQLSGDWTNLNVPHIKKRFAPITSNCNPREEHKWNTNFDEMQELGQIKTIEDVQGKRETPSLIDPTSEKIKRKMNEPTTSDQGVNNIEAQDIESKAKPEEDIKLPVDIVKKLILRERLKKKDKIKRMATKRVGSPMNEMKRSKYTSGILKHDYNVPSRHDNLLKDAINALEMLKLSEQELLMMKKKRSRLRNKKSIVHSGTEANYEKKTIPVIVKKDKETQPETTSLPTSVEHAVESEEEPYDYSQDWSDYDWWGYDGVMKKRNKKDPSQKRAFDILGQFLGIESNENEKGSLSKSGYSIKEKKIYDNRKRRKLGSMR